MAVQLSDALPQVGGLTVYTTAWSNVAGYPQPAPGPLPCILIAVDGEWYQNAWLYVEFGGQELQLELSLNQLSGS